jgi:sulfate permease, SulP family
MSARKAISRYLPIVSGWPPGSSPRVDILAGIALAGLLVPEGMAYAGIAGLPPQMGLYAAMAGMFVYALFGTSRQLAVTSTSSSAAMLAALVAPLSLGNSARYAVLASAATIGAGLIFLLAGLLRMGSVSEFISKPVHKGFVFGLALTIMVRQAHKLMGIPGGHGNFFYQAWHVIKFLTHSNPWSCAVAGAAILTMFLLGAIAPRVPSALVVLVFGILSASLFSLQAHGVEMVGTIQAGMPSPTVPRVVGADVADLFMGTFGIVLVLIAEALSAGRTFAAKHKYEINPNQELCAMGAANVASGLMGGMIVGGGMSGTAANDAGGARTQVSTVTASLFVALTLGFLLPLIRNLPEAALGAIVIHAVAHLADIGTLKKYAKLGSWSLWSALVALSGVLLLGILRGLIFAVALSLVVVMRKLSVPADSILGRLAGSEHFVDVKRNREAEQIPGLLIFRPNGILFFANANRVHKHLRELLKRTSPPLRAVVLDLECCPETDVTSLDMLDQLHKELQHAEIGLYLARLADPVRDLFERGGFLERMGPGRVFPGIGNAAAAACQDAMLIC